MISLNFLKKKPKEEDSVSAPSSDSFDIQSVKVRPSEEHSDIPTRDTNLPKGVISAKTSPNEGGAPTTHTRRKDGKREHISTQAKHGGGDRTSDHVRSEDRASGHVREGNRTSDHVKGGEGHQVKRVVLQPATYGGERGAVQNAQASENIEDQSIAPPAVGGEKGAVQNAQASENIEDQSIAPPAIKGARVLEEEIVGPAPPKEESQEERRLPITDTKNESVERVSNLDAKNNAGVVGDTTRGDKIPTQDSKKDTRTLRTEKNIQNNEDSVETSKTPIPVLKTFYHDAQKLARDGGGSGLREILAKELEARRRAEHEYKNKTKDLLKDAAILREKQKNFGKKESSSSYQKDSEDVANAIAGAVDYIKHGTYEAEKKPDLKDTSKVIVENSPNKESGKTLSSILSEGSLKKTPKIFSDIDQKNLQQKESQIVEREGIRKAWENFEIKKQNLESKGASIRDARPYGDLPAIQKTFFRQNLISVLIVLTLLSGISLIIYSIFTRTDGRETSIITASDLYATEDIITAGGTIPVDVSTDTAEWEAVLLENKTATISKFIPYRIEGVETKQVSFAELIEFRNTSLPQKLLNSLGDYYFIGGYSTKAQDYKVLVLSVRNYSELVVLLLNWERNLISALANLFPNELISITNPSRIILQTAVIDNKNVKILTDPNNRSNDVVYYFFNRDYLVIIVGDTEGVVRINDEIRNSNL